MILVICGADGRAFNNVMSDVVSVMGSRGVIFDMSFLTSPQSRLNRLKLEVGRGTFGSNIKIILGVNDERELAYLRENNAVVAHIYGAMGDIYDCISIQKTDFFVSSNMGYHPHHVLNVSQLLSEVEIKDRLALRTKQQLSSAHARLKQSPHQRA